MAPRNSRRRAASASDDAGEAVNPHKPGTNAHGAFERMQRRRERDKEFAKTAEGKRSAKFHNVDVESDENDGSLFGEGEVDTVELEGRGTSASDTDSGTEA